MSIRERIMAIQPIFADDAPEFHYGCFYRGCELSADLAEARERELLGYCSKMNDDISQTLGKALGYPWFKDDQKNFPEATEAHGVCVGDHVAETLAIEAANKIEELLAQRDELLAALQEAPILSKYHGHHGFEYDRFMSDYSDWCEKKRTAIANVEDSV